MAVHHLVSKQLQATLSYVFMVWLAVDYTYQRHAKCSSIFSAPLCVAIAM